MKDLTIVGRGDSWKDCQFRTPELWGCLTNLAVEGLSDKPYTKLFAFDAIKQNKNGKQFTDTELVECIAKANERNIPIVSNQDYGTSYYPLVQIAQRFKSSYLMPTVSYMLAYAIYEGFDRIYIDGIDQGPRWDYQAGKPHIILWLGVALGKGIELRPGRGSLRWAYQLGLNELPQVFFETDENCLANHIGLDIRKEEEGL